MVSPPLEVSAQSAEAFVGAMVRSRAMAVPTRAAAANTPCLSF